MVTFCPFILIARCNGQDFGNALQSSRCYKGLWEVVDPAKGKTSFQCAFWIERKDRCALAHIAALAQ